MPTITLPTIQDMSLALGGQGSILSLLLLTLGLVFMLLGLRLYTALIVVSYGGLGFKLGTLVPVQGWLMWCCAVLSAVILAVISVYLMRMAVSVLAGGWAGLAVAAMTQPVWNNQASIIAGIAAMIAVVSLGFILYEQIIAFVTSLEGALLLLCGLALLFSQFASTRYLVDGTLGRNSYFTAFLIAGGTVIGYYSQMAEDYKKRAGASG